MSQKCRRKWAPALFESVHFSDMVLLVLMPAAIFPERFESLRWSCWVPWTHGLHASVPSPKVGSSKGRVRWCLSQCPEDWAAKIKINHRPTISWFVVKLYTFLNLSFLGSQHEVPLRTARPAWGGQGSGCRGWGGADHSYTRESGAVHDDILR